MVALAIAPTAGNQIVDGTARGPSWAADTSRHPGRRHHRTHPDADRHPHPDADRHLELGAAPIDQPE
ncbi:hypothetical protein [Nonomuraea sp. NPDC003709]|uniref:hypothetical protein n=1 Tax=Nonomuraea sp. NPDC003709 TaxID=3154450 RepID=UPI0033ADF232